MISLNITNSHGISLERFNLVQLISEQRTWFLEKQISNENGHDEFLISYWFLKQMAAFRRLSTIFYTIMSQVIRSHVIG